MLRALEGTNLVDVLRSHAQGIGARPALTFLRDGEGDEDTLSYEALDRRARAGG